MITLLFSILLYSAITAQVTYSTTPNDTIYHLPNKVAVKALYWANKGVLCDTLYIPTSEHQIKIMQERIAITDSIGISLQKGIVDLKDLLQKERFRYNILKNDVSLLEQKLISRDLEIKGLKEDRRRLRLFKYTVYGSGGAILAALIYSKI